MICCSHDQYWGHLYSLCCSDSGNISLQSAATYVECSTKSGCSQRTDHCCVYSGEISRHKNHQECLNSKSFPLRQLVAPAAQCMPSKSMSWTTVNLRMMSDILWWSPFMWTIVCKASLQQKKPKGLSIKFKPYWRIVVLNWDSGLATRL